MDEGDPVGADASLALVAVRASGEVTPLCGMEDLAGVGGGTALGLLWGSRGSQAGALARLRRVAVLAGPRVLATPAARALLIERGWGGFDLLAGADLDGGDLFALVPGDLAVLSRPVLRMAATGAPLMLAVLPFRAPAGASALQARAWGLSDGVTAGLTRFRGVSVLARGAAWAWRDSGLPAAEIGQRLGVRAVLDGVLRVDPGHTRLDVSLVESDSGRALWAERFIEGVGRGALRAEELEDRVIAGTAFALGQPRPAMAMAIARRATAPLARDLVLEARGHLAALTEAGVAAAEGAVRAALDLDPGYAPARALHARIANLRWRFGWTDDPPRMLETALSEALRALRADPLEARAYGEIGFARLYRREHAACAAAYAEARRLNPNDADLMADAADAMSHMGEAELAVGLLERAMRMNPHYPDLYLWQLGGALFQQRRYGEAVRAILRMQAPLEGRRILAAAYAALGRQAEAEAEAATILAAYPGFTVAGWATTVPDRDPADTRHVADALRRAGLPG